MNSRRQNPRTLKVGVFDQIVSGGGVRLFTTELVREFSRLSTGGWRFHLMWPLFDSSNNFLPRPRLKNVSFERIDLDQQTNKASNRIFRTLRDLFEARAYLKSGDRLLMQLKGEEEKVRIEEQKKLRAGDGRGLRWLDDRADKFDLIYLPYPYLTLPCGEKWRPKKPVVITLHDLAHEHTDTWGDLTENLRREVRRWTEFADLVIFSSDYIKAEAQNIYGLPEARAKRIYLAPAESVKGNQRSDVLARNGVSKKYLFTLGWAAKHKRLETIIEGFALFKRKSEIDVALVVAGPNTENLSAKDLHGLELGRDLFAFGYVPEQDIPVLYQHAEAVLTASVSEAGLNAVIFDAMRYERPVICSNIPQFVERLGSDESMALTFDPLSPHALAESLAKHFADAEQAHRRVKNAKSFINSRTLADVGRDYLDAFRSILEKV